MEFDELWQAIQALDPGEKQELFERLKAEIGEEAGEQAKTPSFLKQSFTVPDAAWEDEADYVILFDGGSEGNPGPGYGSYLLKTRSGRKRITRLEFGEATSNEAEYKTLLAALTELVEEIERAGKSPAEFTVEVRGDSALVVNQVLGRWKAKEPRLKALRDEARRLLSRFKAHRVLKVPREEVKAELGH